MTLIGISRPACLLLLLVPVEDRLDPCEQDSITEQFDHDLQSNSTFHWLHP